jgi:hypothetical protein
MASRLISSLPLILPLPLQAKVILAEHFSAIPDMGDAPVINISLDDDEEEEPSF